MSVCLSVKSNLISGVSVHPENTVTYSAGKEGQQICGVFSETALFKSYGVCLPMTSYEGTAVTFRALNNRLNTTWNTTECKAASFFLFSLHLSSKVFRILFVTRN